MSFVREPNAEPLPGYRLIEPLGDGGFGEVWKCEAPGGIFKAIKFVYGNINSSDVEGVRAEQELHALNRVKEVRHPFVLSLDRIEVVSGELVIVMELADRSLHDRFLECQGAGLVGIPRDMLLRYLRDAAEALDHMNEKHNLQHLDIKPRNLFLVSDRVKVADFGLAKHVESQTGTVGGITPLYAAPETFLGKISPHSDQYSLAIVYQELLTGQRPFNGKTPRQLAMQHAQAEPELRVLPEAERAVIARALSKQPEKRFASCLALVRALYAAHNVGRAEGLIAEGAANGSRRPATQILDDDLLENWGSDSAPSTDTPDDAHLGESQLGLTTHLPDTGVLRPTVVIGLGEFGRRALLDLRCRLLDRVGGLNQIPMIHFLYVDVDPEAVRGAIRGEPEVALSMEEVYHLPLQPVSDYRRRMLEHLGEWLPREKLYAMPRSLQTQGSRALGRLAFVDNHLRLATRLRRELEQVSHPDALYQSVTQTGLALRENRPRIFVIAAAGGGTSGLLVDLGYALRQALRKINQSDGDTTALIFCGAPDDPATPRSEQANIYATLTELNHFTDSSIPFAAQYGVDGPRTVDHGQPYQRVYLLKAPHRQPKALVDAVAHLGSYLFHELTTPLGLRLERCRMEATSEEATIFRSFGTYGVWFPRGLLLRQAAVQGFINLLREWQGLDAPAAQVEVEAACARALADPDLRFEAVGGRVQSMAASVSGSQLEENVTALLAHLEEQAQLSVAQDDPGSWARQALLQVQQLIGASTSAPQDSDWRRGKLSRALTVATHKLAEEWDQRLTDVAYGLMEHPGRRIAAAEAGVASFIRFCEDALTSYKSQLDQQMERTNQASQHLQTALAGCASYAGGFSFFGGRSRRLLRIFVDHLAAFTRQRLAEEVVAATLTFFGTLCSRLHDRLQELSFCRQRLRHLQETLESGRNNPDNQALDTPLAFASPEEWEESGDTQTVRLVLPDGHKKLDAAAAQFIERLVPDQWLQLDQSLQDRVLAPVGGLHQICLTNGDLSHGLAELLLPQIAVCLGDLLPVTDVAEAEFSAATVQQTEVKGLVSQYFAQAAPPIAGKDGKHETGFLLLPASDAGKRFGEESQQVLPEIELIRVPGQDDLMFCREQGALDIHDLQREFQPCRRAYEDAANAPTISPHARFDIVDWVPLDP